MVVTGGRDSYTTVSRYGKEGWIQDLPHLKIARDEHGCSSFLSEDNERVNLINFFFYETDNYVSGVACHRGFSW